MRKCKVCGEKVKTLYDGRCTSCIGDEILGDIGQAELDFIMSIQGIPLKDGELIRMFRESGRVKRGNGKEDNGVEMVITNISKTDVVAKLFETPIKHLYEKYKSEVDSGKYKIELLKNYGVKAGGQVVETRAGVVVYKDIEYYDDDSVDEDIDTDY